MGQVLKKKPEIYPSRVMNPICEMAGCSKADASKHAWKWEKKRWHCHPCQDFVSWWEPFEFDTASGASVGGHPEAHRCWARKDPDGWKRKWYGIQAEDAWNAAHYFNEFDAWRLMGRPAKSEEFVSLAATLERQKQFWHELKGVIANIDKKMLKVSAGDVALEERSPKRMPDP